MQGALDRALPDAEEGGGLGLAHATLNRLDDAFPPIEAVGFHAPQSRIGPPSTQPALSGLLRSCLKR